MSTKPANQRFALLIAFSFMLLFIACEKESPEQAVTSPVEVDPLDTLEPGVWTMIAGESSPNPSTSHSSAGHSAYLPLSRINVVRSMGLFLSASSGSIAGVQRSTDGGFNWTGSSGGEGSFYRFYYVNQDTFAFVLLDDVFKYSRLYYSYNGGANYSYKRTHDTDPRFTYRSNNTKAFDISSSGIPYFITETEYRGFYLGKIIGDSIHTLYKDSLTNPSFNWGGTNFFMSSPSDRSVFFIRQDPDSSAFTATQDSGQSFQHRLLPTTDSVTAMIFLNDHDGIITTGMGSGKIFSSNDGGVNWQLSNQSFSGGVKSVRRQNGRLYLLTFDSKIYHSINGLNWTFYTEVPIAGIENFLFLGDPQDGFVSTEGALYRIRP